MHGAVNCSTKMYSTIDCSTVWYSAVQLTAVQLKFSLVPLNEDEVDLLNITWLTLLVGSQAEDTMFSRSSRERRNCNCGGLCTGEMPAQEKHKGVTRPLGLMQVFVQRVWTQDRWVPGLELSLPTHTTAAKPVSANKDES
jgi:hypothetical protein